MQGYDVCRGVVFAGVWCSQRCGVCRGVIFAGVWYLQGCGVHMERVPEFQTEPAIVTIYTRSTSVDRTQVLHMDCLVLAAGIVIYICCIVTLVWYINITCENSSYCVVAEKEGGTEWSSEGITRSTSLQLREPHLPVSCEPYKL